MSLASLPRRMLGRTGLEVTTVTLGGVGLGGVDAGQLYGANTDKEAVEAVHTALERGINFIDTSPLYAESERRIGLALGELSGGERARVLLSSKVGDECPPYSDNGGHCAFSYDGVRFSVEHSLRLTGADRLDLCLLHDPTMPELLRFLDEGGACERGSGMGALRDLAAQGVVGAIGIGCVDRPQQLRFLEEPDAAAVLSVNDWNLARRYGGEELFEPCAAAGAGVINAGCFYMGLLAAPQTSFEEGFKASLDVPQLRALALRMEAWWEAEHGLPLRVPAVQFAARHAAVGTVAIGCRTAQEVNECCDAVLAPIPERAWDDFEAAFADDLRGFKREWHWYYDKETTEL
jgi:aryl-alcohol dehydrogenase-like predicted oxidoreductase